jgi:hypothetical protein
MTPQTIPDELTQVYLNGVKDGRRKRDWVDLTDQDRFTELQKMDPATMRLPPGLKEFAERIEKRVKALNA